MIEELNTPCHSPYSAPAIIVPEKTGKLRLLLDYETLNKKTIKSCWPIPSIEVICDALQGSAYFTTLHMSWGLHQLPMEPDSQNHTPVSTPFGSFKLATHANGNDGQFKNNSESNETRVCWTQVEHYRTLPRWLHGLFQDVGGTHQKTGRIVSKISRGESGTQCSKTCFLPEKSWILRTCNHQEWTGSRTEKENQYKTFRYHKIKQMSSRRSQYFVHITDDWSKFLQQ